MSLTEFKKYLKTEKLQKLHKLKLELDDAYYNTGKSTFPDDRYDMLKEAIAKRDPKYVPPVGAKVREGENRAELPYWLGSADKITPEQPEVLERWLKNNKSDNYVITEKLDGVSCLYTHKNGIVKLYTRGDGEVGADISYLAGFFSLPELPEKEEIVIRGELIMPKTIFESRYKNTYKNPRNMVSGLLSGKTARQGLKDIRFVTYEIVADFGANLSVQLQKLKKLNFWTVQYRIVQKLSVNNLLKILNELKSISLYELDGIMVQSVEPYDRNTSGNPSYSFAFKAMSEEDIIETEVLDIEWNVTKWGQIKPVVIVNPIDSKGVTINRATGHNASYVEENSLGPGAVIKITRSKDVIPYIVDVVIQAEKPKMPNIPYVWDKNHVNILSQTFDSEMCIKVISDIFSKLGIKHVSEATVKKLFANGLDNFFKIIGASKERLLQVPEFHEKSAERIYTNIRSGLTNVKTSTLLGASGVLGYGIGEKRIEALLLDIPNLFDKADKIRETEIIQTIEKVEGFSEIMAKKVATNLKYGKLFLKKMEKYCTFAQSNRVSEDMHGLTFVATGFRDKNLENDVKARGGKFTSAISKKTTALIVAKKGGEKPTGKLLKAQQLGIPIYTKGEFMEKYLEKKEEKEKKVEKIQNDTKKYLSEKSWYEFFPCGMKTDFTALWNLKPKIKPKLRIYGELIETPRYFQSYGISYKFSGVDNKADEIPDEIKPISEYIHEKGYQANQILANWYENGLNYISAHSDDETQIIPSSPIVSLSLGETRKFRIREKGTKKIILDVDLGDNTIFVMGGDFQKEFTHEIVKVNGAKGKKIGKRINLTFRLFKK